MFKARPLTLFSFVLLVVIFLLGLVQLFVLRFELGDVYPAYSTLRADPLGAMVFYESLENLPKVDVGRNYQLATVRPNSSNGTWFYLGVQSDDAYDFDKRTMEAFEEMVSEGGRLVSSFAPEDEVPDENEQENGGTGDKEAQGHPREATAKSEGGDKNLDKESTTKSKHWVAMTRRWGFDLKNTGFADPAKVDSLATLARGSANRLPGSIRWLTTLVFEPLDAAWRVVYLRDGHAVLMERPWGKGSIVLSADSYFLSNEALMTHRYPGLLSWLVHDNTSVVFDETQFGVAERLGIAALGRKYRLHGMFFGLLLLAAAYAWKSASGFVPEYFNQRYGAADEEVWVEGKDASAGFINLLRRAVASKEILTVCFFEWKKALPKYLKHSRKKLEDMEAVIRKENIRPARQRDPVRGYQAMVQIWTEGKG